MDLKQKLKEINEYRSKGYSWDYIKEMGFNDNDRKAFYGYEVGLRIDDNEIIARQITKLKIEKQKSNILKQQVNELIRYKTYQDLIREQKNKITEEKFNILRKKNNKNKSFYIITISDFHFSGHNEELMNFSKIGNSIIDFIEDNKLDNLIIAELGDTIEGASLRTSQLQGIKSGMIDQARIIGKVYRQMLDFIIEETGVKLTYVGVDSSNHTQLRTFGTKRNELVEEDLMKFINDEIANSKRLYRMFRGDEIILNIDDYVCYFAHGHTTSSNKPRLSFNNISQRLNTVIDFMFLGHFHNLQVYDMYKAKREDRRYDRRLFFVPSACDIETQYEKDLNLSSESGYGIFEFDDKNGNISVRKIVI